MSGRLGRGEDETRLLSHPDLVLLSSASLGNLPGSLSTTGLCSVLLIYRYSSPIQHQDPPVQDTVQMNKEQ